MRLQQLKYPFLTEARELARKLAKDTKVLVDFLDKPENEYIIEEAEDRVFAALTRSEIKLVDTKQDKDVLIYPTSRLIVEEIGHPRLKEYQAEVESKAVNKHLSKESDSYIIGLCESSFGWRVELTGSIRKRVELPVHLSIFEFRISFENFLEVAPNFHSKEWKLVNRFVEEGWIPIRRSELDRLVSEKFKQLILQSTIDVPDLPQRLAESVDRIEAELRGRIRRTETYEVTDDAFPPCIAQMHEDASRGKNLPHPARFALASFLLKIGKEEQEVMSTFGATPDGTDKGVSSNTRYQVGHIHRKDGEGYMPPGCKKLQGNGLCPVYLGQVFDPLCEYVLHPLNFYQIRAWEMSRPIPIVDRSWYAKRKRKRQSF